MKDRGDLSVYINIEGKALILCLILHHVHKIVQHGYKAVIHIDDIHSAGFDLGKVQNVIDDPEKRISRRPDVLGIAQDRFVLTVPHHHFV